MTVRKTGYIRKNAYTFRRLASQVSVDGTEVTLSVSGHFAASKAAPKCTLHCLIEDTCLLFSRTAFLLDAFYCTLDDYLKDQCVYYCTLDFD